MKIKIILFLLIICLFIFLINYNNIDNKEYYLSIGEEIKIKNKLLKNKKIEKEININRNDYRVTDVINDINDNNYDFQKHLIKADILVLNINNEIKYKINNLNYNYIDSLLIDIDKLISLIRKYDKEKIYYVLPNNNNNKYIKYFNERLKEQIEKYSIEIISIN